MKILKHNWKIKLLSVIGAIILWSFVISEENPQISTLFSNIPVVYENENALESKGLVIMDQARPSVNVYVKGNRNQIINLSSQQIRVTSDLSKYDEGVHNLDLNVSLPNGLVLDGEPSPVSLDIQAIISKDFEVGVDLQGVIEEGYILESTKITPEFITAKGPRSQIEKIRSVNALLNTENLNKDIVSNVSIEAVDTDGNIVDNITLGQNFVNINAVVNKSKEVPIAVETSNQLSSNLRLKSISINPETVFIKGDQTIIDGTQEIRISPIDLSRINSSGSVGVELVLPSGVNLVDEGVNYVARLEIEEKIEKTIDIPTSSVQRNNLETNRTLEIPENSFAITISGFPDVVEDAGPNNFETSLNLASYEDGVNTARPIVLTDLDVSILNIEDIEIIIR